MRYTKTDFEPRRGVRTIAGGKPATREGVDHEADVASSRRSPRITVNPKRNPGWGDRTA